MALVRLLTALLPSAALSHGQIRSRQLTFETLVGYTPRTQVTDHAALDLDQDIMEQELFLGRMDKARNVYIQGGHSKSYAELNLKSPTGSKSYPKGTEVYGLTPSGGEVYGKLMEDVSWNSSSVDVQILVQYHTSDIQEHYVSCQVGGLFTFSDANRDGCFNDTGAVSFIAPDAYKSTDDNAFPYYYSIRQDNKNGRTLQSLSLDAETSMRKSSGECVSTCPLMAEFQLFKDYYGTPHYADKWVTSAFYKQATNYPTGNDADFSTIKYKSSLAEGISKATAYMTVFMSVIREIEDALDDCENNCPETECNDDPVNSIDAAVAFYAGSLEGPDGSGSGKFLYDLADKRALDFRTCGEFGTEEDGTSFVNLQIVREFKKAQLYLQEEQCSEASKTKETIVNYMKVPLVQSVLRYAYMRNYEKSDNEEIAEKEMTEGATYAAALLPFVHACSASDAKLIYNNMHLGSTSVSFERVKSALEKNYDCLGITCADVGGIWTVNGYSEHGLPCGEVVEEGAQYGSKTGDAKGARSGMVAFTTMATIFFITVLGFFVIRQRNRKRARKNMQRRSGNIAAVTEIA